MPSTIGGGVFIASSTIPHMGLGLFAGVPFLSGQLITEYSGRVVPFHVTKHMSFKEQLVHCGGMWINGIQHPRKQCGGGSFANRLERGYNAEISRVGNKLFLKVRQGRAIQVGEEIVTSQGTGFHTRLAIAVHKLPQP